MFSSVACVAYVVAPLLAALAALYRFSVSTYDKWERSGVPYAKPVVPLFGNFLGVVSGAEHQVDLFRRVYRQLAGHKYGGLFLMRTPCLMIRDPEMVHNVFVKDFDHFQNRGIHTDYGISPLTENLFFMKNPRWKAIRNRLSPAFTSGKLRAMYGQIKECGDELMRGVGRELAAGGHEIEVREPLGNYSIDVIGSCAFGLRLNAVGDAASEFRKYGKMVFQPSVRFLLRELCVMISPAILKVIKVRDFPKEALDFFHRAFAATIEHRERNDVVRNDIVDHLMQARRDLVLDHSLPEEQKFTDTQIIANAFVMFSAGFETTSTSISFCLYELALKKHIQDKVRAEIKTKIAKYNGEISNDFLTDLDYLEMVIAETLRKHPILSALVREATETYQVPNDSLIIEKGQKIIIPIHSLHYDPRYFPDPDLFDPERFSPEEKSKRPKCCYVPFGEGPRICIGKRFAEIEMKLALSEILSKFEVEPCEKTQIPMRYSKMAFTVMPEDGVWLRFKPITIL